MKIPLERPSATIYEFPVRSRGGVGRVTSSGEVLALSARQPSRVAYDECWYHQAAVERDRPLRN